MPPIMTPAEHKACRTAAGLTHQALADAIGTSRVSVTRRESGTMPSVGPIAVLMRYVRRYGPPSIALTEDNHNA